jgi:hypothetical protein
MMALKALEAEREAFRYCISANLRIPPLITVNPEGILKKHANPCSL